MKILACVDLSDSTEIIVNTIEELAKSLSAHVWLLHNAEPESDQVTFRIDPMQARETLAKKFHNEHRQIQHLADRLRDAGVEATALLVRGETVEAILKEASDVGADMIVVGSHGTRAKHDMHLGSVSECIMQKSSLPVLVIPTHDR